MCYVFLKLMFVNLLINMLTADVCHRGVIIAVLDSQYVNSRCMSSWGYNCSTC